MLTGKDYCDYETCVALKELGFNQYISIRYYAGEGGVRLWDFDGEPNYKEGEMIALSDMYDVPRDGNEVAAPSLYEAQKWMREEKEVEVAIIPEYNEFAPVKGVQYRIWVSHWKDNEFGYETIEIVDEETRIPFLYKTYTEALSEGIKEAVKILKEK